MSPLEVHQMNLRGLEMIILLSDIGFYFLIKILKFNSLLRANNNFWNTDKEWKQRNELAAQRPQVYHWLAQDTVVTTLKGYLGNRRLECSLDSNHHRQSNVQQANCFLLYPSSLRVPITRRWDCELNTFSLWAHHMLTLAQSSLSHFSEPGSSF